MLMHGLLALAALHRARDDSARRDFYRTRALHHHGVGLPLFQKVLASASPKNAEVLVAYALLLGICVYAFPKIAAEKLSLDDMLDMSEVVRGARTVCNLYRDVVIQKPIGLFLRKPSRKPLPERHVSPVRDTLQALQDSVQHPSDESAVHQLQMVLERYMEGLDHTRAAAGWMATVENDYWTRLRDHHPYALLVFAHSSLLVRASEDECWWLSGWSEGILQACSGVLSQVDRAAIDWEACVDRIRTLGVDLANCVALENA